MVISKSVREMMRVTGSDKRDKVSSQLIVQCCAWVMHEILPGTYLRAALLFSVWSVSFFFFSFFFCFIQQEKQEETNMFHHSLHSFVLFLIFKYCSPSQLIKSEACLL